MLYIFSSNGNNYTFKKLDNMLINMPEKDGSYVLIREQWMVFLSTRGEVRPAS